MIAFLTLVILGGLAQETPPPCDDECKAVLTAALQWTIETTITEYSVDPASIRVDVSSIRDEDRTEERNELGGIARDMSLVVEDLRRNPAFLTCIEDRRSRACRDAPRLAWIGALSVRFTGPGEVTARSLIRVMDQAGGYETNWVLLQGSELFLEMRDDGTWEVVGVGVIVVT